MAIKLIQHNDIDRGKWDALIERDDSALIFSCSWYLDAVCATWGAYVQGDYEGVFPLSMSQKGGVGHLYLPFFVRELNVVGTMDTSALISLIDQDFKRISVASSSFQDINQWSIQQNHHQLLALQKPHSEIESGYSTNAKRLIKKALKESCRLEQSKDTKWIIEGFKSGKGKSISTLNSRSFDILSRLMIALENNEAVDVFEIWQGKMKLAAGCFMKHKNRVTYLKGHVTDEGKSIGAMFLLIDRAINSYTQSHDALDFGGSKIKSVAQFYKKFGAIDSNYLFLKKDNSPKIHKALRMLRSKFKKR